MTDTHEYNSEISLSKTTPSRKIPPVLVAAIGNTLEWYDFTVYALFASYIGDAILHMTDPMMRLAGSFLIFGLGAIARPVGGVLFGFYADMAGRGKALSMAMWLMGFGTLLIVGTPTYALAGTLSIIMISLARILQGVSAGGEMGSATAYLVEQTESGRSGRGGAWLQATMGLSNLLGAIVASIVTALLTTSQIAAWGWRIPFIVGLLIVPVGVFVRRMSTTQKNPVRPGTTWSTHNFCYMVQTLLKEHRPGIKGAMGLSLLWAAAPYSLIIFMPIYGQIALGIPSHTTYVASLIGNIFLVSGCLTSGFLADRFGARQIIMCASVMLFIFPLPLLMWAKGHPDLFNWVLVQILLSIMVSLFVGTAPLAIAQFFPESVRATGIAFTYNSSVAIFGGFAPALLTFMYSHLHVFFSPAFYVMIMALLCMLALLHTWKTTIFIK
ncbi:MFS transporter [Komagataeibacter swingsii]|uniref:MFS transporter n=1 Tax=Komagataeibacter swingsii TaxID=215220 RepID=A0A850P9N7_9PROT|nr:MFS transporter [Komagataeibacter swingsii]NVN38602.1 MFS transporter [Komagataeibacter swingsii]